ncbi:GerAB/ArcD/ProY family transporter [Desmospora profundinema]|uniref:Spore germination protein KB n=1 Tax=Desmospora profundinema TaxID=1571184 RepID=A0ABU1IKA4_9BACL|nr:endospore germination permease [Desmospora profundinema]MDR6225210.1 spore germination protein KB [Desmospora profundinema]
MEKAKISAFQLFSLILLFELGSALVVGLGMDAEKDAWLAILIGMTAGLVLFLIYERLFRYYPDLPLTGFLQKILGKPLGWVFGLAYVLYFIYIGSRVLRDFIDLLITTEYGLTPELVIGTMMILTMIYVLMMGIEVLARLGEIHLIIMIMLGLVANFFIHVTELVEINRLLPVLEEGWKPVLETAFPLTMTFPFGEMIVFTMLFPYLNRPKKLKRIGLGAMVASGLILAYTIAINIAVLGADVAARSPFPLMGTVGRIIIAEVIQNLDVVALWTLIIGGFFKISLFFYVAVLGVTDLFNIKRHQSIVIPIGIILLISSLIIAENFAAHIEEGLEVVPKYLHLPFQVGIPVLLLIIAAIRHRFMPQTTGTSKGS